MRTSIILKFIVSLSMLILVSGCVDVNKQFAEIKDKIMGELGTDYNTEFQFSFGSAAITVSSWFVSLAADEEYVDEMLREISSVQVGVYNRVEGLNTKVDFSTLVSIDEEMKSKGWKYIVRSVERDEITAIYIRDDLEEMLNKIYIINVSNEELVIVEVNGDLKKVISYVIEEKNLKLKT